MADNGVTTPFLAPASLADELIANRDGSTVRVAMPNVAAQLAATGAVADRIAQAEGLVTTGARTAATWSDLLAETGDFDGQGGEVLDADVGTHDAASATGYDGSSVANAGRYAWNDAWARWVRIGDTGLAAKADVTALDAEAIARAAGDAALAAGLEKLTIFEVQSPTFTAEKFIHKTTAVETTSVNFSYAEIVVSEGQVVRLTAKISGDPAQIACLVWLDGAGDQISFDAAAQGAGVDAIFDGALYTAPAGTAAVAFNILNAEAAGSRVELRKTTDAVLAGLADDVRQVMERGEGYYPVNLASEEGFYYATTGSKGSFASWTRLAPLPVAPGQTIRSSGIGNGVATARVVYLNAAQAFLSSAGPNGGSPVAWKNVIDTVPASAAYALFCGYGEAPVVEVIGFAGATREELTVVSDATTEITTRVQGYGLVDAAVLEDTYYIHYNGEPTTFVGYTSLEGFAVTPGEVLKITANVKGGNSALVCFKTSAGVFVETYKRGTDTEEALADHEVAVPATAGLAYVASRGSAPPIVKQHGLNPANMEDVFDLQDDIALLHPLSRPWAGTTMVGFGTSITAATDAPSRGMLQVMAGLLGATVTVYSVPSSAARAGRADAIAADDPHGWTGTNFNNLKLALSHTIADKTELITNYASKWKARTTGGPASIDPTLEAEILGCSYENRMLPNIGGAHAIFLEHLRNDASFGSGGVSGSEINIFPGKDVMTDVLGNPVDEYHRSWGIGAMNYLIREILQSDPFARVFLVGHYDASRDPWIAVAQQRVADFWGIPVIPLWALSGWNDNEITVGGSPTTTLKQWLPDEVHPRADVGNLHLGTILARQMLSLK